MEADRPNLGDSPALSLGSKNSKELGKISNTSKIISHKKINKKIPRTAAKEYRNVLLKNK